MAQQQNSGGTKADASHDAREQAGASPQVHEALSHLLPMPTGRKIIAIAGAPGSGKSTIAEALCTALNEAGRTAVVVPMDGFHLDNGILVQRGLLARKGAPATFDAEGFVHLIRRISLGEEVVYPVFDRDRDMAIAGAAALPTTTEFVLVEGNYLLLNEAPWSGLALLWDVSILIEAPLAVLEDRLLQRWLDQGLSPEQARRRRDANDLPNAMTVRSRSGPADITIPNG